MDGANLDDNRLLTELPKPKIQFPKKSQNQNSLLTGTANPRWTCFLVLEFGYWDFFPLAMNHASRYLEIKLPGSAKVFGRKFQSQILHLGDRLFEGDGVGDGGVGHD